ncbi:hypothetical protein HZP17_03590 [Elizabethkingia anophelis]|jgi:hypothetical protein|nr:hypothetical protein [Elizabethkingia anophelis]
MIYTSSYTNFNINARCAPYPLKNDPIKLNVKLWRLPYISEVVGNKITVSDNHFFSGKYLCGDNKFGEFKSKVYNGNTTTRTLAKRATDIVPIVIMAVGYFSFYLS